MEHQAMLTLMEAKGFGEQWLLWMKNIFSCGISSILLNGVPGKTFHCRRGVRQGDPLSPLLFVLASDFLQTLVNHAKDQGRLHLPIHCQHATNFPIVQYTKDTLIIMEGCTRQLQTLQELLSIFSRTTGLIVNFSKSMMVPVGTYR
jgi:hypothetical protein